MRPRIRRALRSASTLVLLFASVGAYSMRAEAEPRGAHGPSSRETTRADRDGRADREPLQDVQFAVCPCWLTPKELMAEIEEFHSRISFECYLSGGSFSLEISAYSSGVGGPFQSEVFTPQHRSVSESRCRHTQVRPRIRVAESEELRTTSQRAACISIVTRAAAELGCKD